MSKNSSIYLIAQYFIRPKSARVKTQLSGWMKDADNVSYDEQVSVARKLKNSDHTTAKIILDLGNKTIVKNGWQSGSSFDELFGYFLNNYPQYVAGPMSHLDPEYLTKFNTKKDEPVAESTTVSSTISSAE